MSEEAVVRQAVVPMNLLVVDDELHVRQLCADVAGHIGMNVTTVSSAEEAVLAEGDSEAPRLDTVVNALAVYAPVIVLGNAECEPRLDALIAAGAVDYVSRVSRAQGEGAYPQP